jgi:hypothetical protein
MSYYDVANVDNIVTKANMIQETGCGYGTLTTTVVRIQLPV